ncbi:Domain of uncharacterised function (DUF2825) [Ectopseudomonas oleovorans]|uniref:Domain of uncharacterized function (DUF2825) n=1 Tax=Ectopseudomonas oleovorans TaxID=301 RepID=A0A379K2Z0_ECTOL|nr:Domain of uncharacterised function (DUF2825) [Pseudomonas oleovorans]
MKRDGRFIPAGAGNTSGAACAVLSASVHPRWRGEHAYRQVQGNEDAGSSPLARGTHLQLSLGNLQIRFIPAGAGNTNWSREVQRFSSVHPRWRGEHRLGQTLPPLSHGSSPLARGTLSTAMVKVTAERFIPAGAGNTKNISHSIRSTTVHPRWRGEHIGHDARRPFRAGSSPLARGTRSLRFAILAAIRFIPAGAGNTAQARFDTANGTVHPRWRGEHSWAPQIVPLGVRFIPAGAGNTSRADQGCLFQPVHPRWRGEHR